MTGSATRASPPSDAQWMAHFLTAKRSREEYDNACAAMNGVFDSGEIARQMTNAYYRAYKTAKQDLEAAARERSVLQKASEANEVTMTELRTYAEHVKTDMDKISGEKAALERRCQEQVKELGESKSDAWSYRALLHEAARNPTFKTIFDSLEKIVDKPGADAE